MTSNSEAPAKAQAAGLGVRTLGKYELQKQLGAGGMGAVYLAKDTQLKRLVALKVLPADKAKNAILVRRFRSEAQAAAQMRHDHIVSVYENGEADGHLFIAMEFVDGTDLHELIRKRGKIPVKRSLEIVKQVTEALEHAYELNIVHRDIKPSNLLIRNDGVVKLTDLGLARSIDDTLETDITRAGTTVGTVDYMSPEQGRSSKLADIRSDLYSLGCTWYHMLTGRPPFSEGSMTNKLQAHATSPIPNPQELNENVTEGMVAVIQRLMAKKPQDRYQTPGELLKDLASPSLTRGGVAQEVMTAINEDTNDTVVARKAPKRGLPAGSLPPKKKAKVEAEDDKPSLLDWETLQPLVWGAVILAAIAALGTTVAYFSGGFDFGSGKITKVEDRPNEVQGDQVVQSPKTATPGPNHQQPAPPEIGPKTLVSPEIAGNTDGTENPNLPAADSGATRTIASPGSSADSVAQEAMNFDPEEIPEWSQSLSAASGESSESPNGSVTSNAAGAGKSSGSPGSIRNTPSSNSKSPSSAHSTGAVGKSGPPGSKQTAAPSLVDRSQVLSIGAGLSIAARGPALAEALKSLSGKTAVIRLSGSEPFILPQIELHQAHLKLVADEGANPIVLFRPMAGELTAGLRMIDGVLEAEEVHFALDRSAFAGSDVLPMIDCVDGQLLVRRCSFSVWGTGSISVRALSFASRQEMKGLPSRLAPRVLLDHVAVKGQAATALAVLRATADVVVRDSLLAGGERPVVELSGTLPARPTKSPPDKMQRAIRFVQSTLAGHRALIQASSEGPDQPPTTAILWQDSIGATFGATGESVLLDAERWPRASETSKIRLANLMWTMKDSAAIGFHHLAALSSQAAIRPQELEAWQSLWNKPFHASQFPTSAWLLDAAGDVSTLNLKSFDRGTLPPGVEALQSGGSSPGCDVSALPELSSGLHPWLSALTAKPAFPAQPPPATKPEVVTLEISKQQDLGVMLQNGTWPAGTVLEVNGAGSKQMTPVKLVNKNWKITWRAQEGAPLTLTPKLSTNEVPALITVEGGQIEISNLRFQIPAAKRTSITSLIAAENARLTLNNIWLQGVMNENNTLESLLHWTSGPTAADGMVPYLACQNSVFTGSESAVRLNLGPAPAFLRNCLIVSRGDGLDVRFGSLPAGQPAGPLVADRLTISAANSVFRLRSSDAGNGLPPHRFYVDHCVFAPPLSAKGDDRTPAVFSVFDPTLDLVRVDWWGTANGVAPEISAMIRKERDAKPNPQEVGLSRWKSTWTREQQDIRLLTGPGGVVMTEQFSNKPGTIKPSQFVLHTNAKAAKWAEGNKPIGVDVRGLEVPIPAAKPKDAKSKDAKPAQSPAAKKVNQPDF